MSLMQRVANALGYEKRDISSKDPRFAEFLGMRSASGGAMVTPESATGVAAVHACVQLVAETVASLPLAPYRRVDGGGKEIDTAHPLFKVLHDQANELQTAMEFREQFIASCLLTGNGYARKEIDGRGAVIALWPLLPGSIQPLKLKNGRIRYQYQKPEGGTEQLLQEEVLHLRYRSEDGILGLSPLQIARQTLSIAISQQEYQDQFYKNYLRPAGVLSFKEGLTKEQMGVVRESVDEFKDGGAKAGKMMFLPAEAKFEKMSLSLEDAQFAESKKLTLDDIARIYRVPPSAIGILTDATYSNISEESRRLVMYTLRPWFVRVEQAMNSCLLTEMSRKTHIIEHNAEGLLRGNQKDRFESYRVASECGWMNVNEIRSKENLSGIGAQGDVYRQPMNSQALGGNDES